jgi:hypothetical protein
LVTVAAYAAAHGKSERQVQRYVRDGRIPGAVMVDGVRLIPADATPTSSTLTTSTTSPTSEVSPTSTLGSLGTLEQAAAILGTSVGGVRRLAADPASPFVVGRFGPRGALRVYVAPR